MGKRITEENIQKAKSVSIEKMFKDKLRLTGKLLQGRCPFHKDNINPNFYIYPDNNSFYCFACGAGGDSIDYYMKMNPTETFEEAVRSLNRL